MRSGHDGFLTGRSAHGRTTDADELFVQTINRLRHDWMNDVQVLYGYLKLKKYDKMNDYVETIVQKMIRESLISRLGIPSLVVYLQSFRAVCSSVELQVELPEPLDLNELPVDPYGVAEMMMRIMDGFKRFAIPRGGEPNRLFLRLSAEGERLWIRFDYRGEYEPALEAELVDIWNNGGRNDWEANGYFGNSRAECVVQVPYAAKEKVATSRGGPCS